MKGLDLCKKYFFECVKPIIDEKFSSVYDINDYYSCALIGWGSDVLRNDDEFSRDHEWGPRLLIFVDEEHKYAIPELDLLLNKYVPVDFSGFKTRFVFDEDGIRVPYSCTNENDNKDNKNENENKGVVNIDFFIYDGYIKDFLGVTAPESDLDWLCIPENKLFEITSGEIFYDANNLLQKKLKVYRDYYPLDIWKYRLAYLWENISWDIDTIGLLRKRGNIISEKIAVYKTVMPIIKLISAYNRKYSPSYCKHIGTEFYKLPYISNETGILIEECLKTDDVAKIKSNLETIIENLIVFHNSYSELPKIYAEKPKSIIGRGFWDIDCQKIAGAIHESIDSESDLKKIPLYGAADQFVTNEDFLIVPELLKKLNGVYKI